MTRPPTTSLVDCPLCDGRTDVERRSCTFCRGTGSYPVSSQHRGHSVAPPARVDLGRLPGSSPFPGAAEATAFRAGYDRGRDVQAGLDRVDRRVAIIISVAVGIAAGLAIAPFVYGWLVP